MKQKIIILICVIAFVNVQAQETIPTSGGEANGSGGFVSYTVGQTVYTTNTGTNGNSVAQGVQQSFEISEVTGVEKAKSISLIISAYPNPTTNYLILNVENYETVNLQYQLFDINGKLLQTVKATNNETQIKMSNLTPANYFVKVLDNKKEIKVFKIIKTD